MKITHYTVVIIIMLDSGAEMIIYFQDYLELLKDYKLFHIVIRNQDIHDIVVYGHQIGMNHAHTGVQFTLSSCPCTALHCKASQLSCTVYMQNILYLQSLPRTLWALE